MALGRPLGGVAARSLARRVDAPFLLFLGGCGLYSVGPAKDPKTSWVLDFTDFPEVCKSLRTTLGEAFGKKTCKKDFEAFAAPQVFYVCGHDLYSRAGQCFTLTMSKIGVVVIPRAGSAPARTNLAKLVIGVTELNTASKDLSSTRARAALSHITGETSASARVKLVQMVDPVVVEILLQHLARV